MVQDLEFQPEARGEPEHSEIEGRSKHNAERQREPEGNACTQHRRQHQKQRH